MMGSESMIRSGEKLVINVGKEIFLGLHYAFIVLYVKYKMIFISIATDITFSWDLVSSVNSCFMLFL